MKNLIIIILLVILFIGCGNVIETTKEEYIPKVETKLKEVSVNTSKEVFKTYSLKRPIDDKRKWTVKYDPLFRKYSKRYFGPNFEWRWYKSQAAAESALKLNQKSSVGAKGIMQIMPPTWKEIKGQQDWIAGDIHDPKWNIPAGIYYNSRLWKIWKDDRDELDRIYFMLGSYNCGVGNVLKAQKRCIDGCNKWTNIEAYVPEETHGYVRKISLFMGKTIESV